MTDSNSPDGVMRDHAASAPAAGATAGRDKRPRDPELWIHKPIDKYRKPRHALEYRPDAAFFELADAVVQSGRTLLGYDRLYVFWQAIRNVSDMSGAVAEVGSFRGGSAYFIASSFKSLSGSEAEIHIFDTFEGHPADKITDSDPFHKAGQFDGTSYDDVRQYLSPFADLHVHKGEVSTSLPGLPDRSFRLVHIDTDLYQPTLECLAYFGQRLIAGGVCIIDDYASKKCPGVPKAVAEYLGAHGDFHAWDMRTEQLMLVKRESPAA